VREKEAMTAMNIPTTAQAQLAAARELGHVLTVNSRDLSALPEDAKKYVIECSCGYRATVRRLRPGVSTVIVRHMIYVLGRSDQRAV
jgi:hypothetical protein